MRNLLVVLLLLAQPGVDDELIFENFTAIQSGGAFVGGPAVPSPPFAPTQQAMPFTVTAPDGFTGYVLTAVEAAVEWAGYGPNLVRISVYNDNGGEPGAELDAAEVAGTTLEPTLGHAAMSAGVFLEDGATYWVVLYGVADSEFEWAPGDPKTYSGVNLYHDPVAGGPWIKPIGDLDLAFEVRGTPGNAVASEPATWGTIKAMFR